MRKEKISIMHHRHVQDYPPLLLRTYFIFAKSIYSLGQIIQGGPFVRLANHCFPICFLFSINYKYKTYPCSSILFVREECSAVSAVWHNVRHHPLVGVLPSLCGHAREAAHDTKVNLVTKEINRVTKISHNNNYCYKGYLHGLNVMLL